MDKPKKKEEFNIKFPTDVKIIDIFEGNFDLISGLNKHIDLTNYYNLKEISLNLVVNDNYGEYVTYIPGFKLINIPSNVLKISICRCSRQHIDIFKLPKNVYKLSFFLTNFTDLDFTELPENLIELEISNPWNISIYRLDNLPPKLKRLEIRNINTLVYLDNLPPKLKRLEIHNINTLVYLDNLPTGLEELIVNNTNIINLNYLPSSLINLDCEKNNIEELDNLPIQLKYLNCSYNKITQINNLPPKLEFLDCSNNKITQINNLPPKTELPNTLVKATFMGNKLITKPKTSSNKTLINYELDKSNVNWINRIIQYLDNQKYNIFSKNIMYRTF